jgi:peptidoglycan/LPS O-acetylase OafA/YrhL
VETKAEVNKRFELLDGTRGLAAGVVMIFHLTALQQVFERGWAAVDLFFILSGFVITYSYGDKIKLGMTFKDFFVARFLRLWPLMALGLTMGLVASAVHRVGHAPDGSLSPSVLSSYLLNLAFLPYFDPATQVSYADVTVTGMLFPIDAPAWSLFFEMFIGLAYFGYVAFAKKTESILLAACGMGGYIFCLVVLGWGHSASVVLNFIDSFPRVIGEFFLGGLVCTYRDAIKLQSKVLVAILAVLIALSFSYSFVGSRILCVTLLYPAFVLFASKIEVSGAVAKLCDILGNISYPLYILHYPIYRILYDALGLGVHSVYERTAIAVIAITPWMYVAARLDTRLRNYLFQAYRRASMSTAVAQA